ncbi:MAG: glucokinase [Pseudomonadota bacterium]|nr:glucokinase [Pseudomonadota bacterium]
MGATDRYLVADIGGTNARFAMVSGSVRSGFELEETRRLKNEDFEHLRDAAHAFLESCSGGHPSRACFAVAGPVSEGKVKLTNSTWRFCPKDLAEDLRLEQLLPVNDFAAQARGAPLSASWGAYCGPPAGSASTSPSPPPLSVPGLRAGPPQTPTSSLVLSDACTPPDTGS